MYAEDTPVFERSKVELELPERLFSNTFTTVSKLSKIIGKFLKDSSRRFLSFAGLLKPIFGNALIIKESADFAVYNVTSTTVMPHTTNAIDNFIVTTDNFDGTSGKFLNLNKDDRGLNGL